MKEFIVKKTPYKPLIRDIEQYMAKVDEIDEALSTELNAGDINCGVIHSRDHYIGGGFDENGVWDKYLGDGPSSLRVSGTVDLRGEVHAEDASFHTHHMDVNGELKVSGDAKFDHDVRMTHSLKVDSKIEAGAGATIKGNLDMKGNNIKNVQELEVEGTLTSTNDIKMLPNTSRADQVKLADALNEALDYSFKNRIQIDGKDVNTITDYISYPTPLDKALHLIETTSASIIDLKDKVITYELTKPITINKSVTFKGSKKQKAVLHFIVNGPSTEECCLFNLAHCDLSIGFDNVEIIVESTSEAVLDVQIVKNEALNANRNLNFTLSDDGTYYIVSGKNEIIPEIVIPAMYQNLPVKEIADEAFIYCNDITKVIISNGVTHIGNNAFNDCNNLGSVYIPASVGYVGKGAFHSCEGSSDGDVKIYCEGQESQAVSWDAEWNDCDNPVTWSVPVPAYSIKLINFSTNMNPSHNKYWDVYGCNLSITDSTLTSKDKFIGNANKFWYFNNNGVDAPNLEEFSWQKTSSLDFFRGELRVNNSPVVTEASVAPVALSGNFNDLEFPWDVEFIFDGGDIDVTVAKLDNYYLS